MTILRKLLHSVKSLFSPISKTAVISKVVYYNGKRVVPGTPEYAMAEQAIQELENEIKKMEDKS